MKLGTLSEIRITEVKAKKFSPFTGITEYSIPFLF